jgi:charged multivesicular body protein 7
MTFQEILSTRPNASKARLPALYADFRPLKRYNPEGYEANIQVWQSTLSTSLQQGLLSRENTLVLDVNSQLTGDISLSPWGRPLGLGSVVNEAVQSREWIPLDVFLSESVSIYERSWSVTGVVGWMWKKLMEYSSGESDEVPFGRFVIRKNLEVFRSGCVWLMIGSCGQDT